MHKTLGFILLAYMGSAKASEGGSIVKLSKNFGQAVAQQDGLPKGLLRVRKYHAHLVNKVGESSIALQIRDARTFQEVELLVKTALDRAAEAGIFGYIKAYCNDTELGELRKKERLEENPCKRSLYRVATGFKAADLQMIHAANGDREKTYEELKDSMRFLKIKGDQ